MTKRNLAKFQNGWMLVKKLKYLNIYLWSLDKKELEDEAKKLGPKFEVVPYYKKDKRNFVVWNNQVVYVD